MDISAIINEWGENREDYFQAMTPPIFQTSNFRYETVAAFRQAFQNEFQAYLYSRGNNPTVDILRQKLAALEGAEDCLVFNSGIAAITAAVLAQVQSGDHIVCVDQPYSWVQKLLNETLPKFGVHTSFVDGRYIESFERAILPNTKLIYLESPNTWDFALQDLAAVAALARAENIVTICDNSYCTGIWQQPIALGIDITVQSATKYISGHSDTVAGVLCGSRAMMQRIFNSEYMTIGSGIQPFNAWLLIRGLRTLPVRLERVAKTTATVLAYLQTQPLVEKIFFPFDPSFDQYELARQQMKGAGGLLSFVLKADRVEAIEAFCEQLQHIWMAVSWGGYESLIIPRCAGMPREQFDAGNPVHRMIRLYVGLEEPDYLIRDLEQAFVTLKAASPSG